MNTLSWTGCPRTCRHSGFTLVEMMIVVVIIGLLATMAIPTMKQIRSRSQDARFISDLRTHVGAFESYILESRTVPDDGQPGQIPDGMEGWLSQGWMEDTSIGGQWDWDKDQFGFNLGVGVYRPNADQDRMQRIDGEIDDGNLNTGRFRQRSDGYDFIIE